MVFSSIPFLFFFLPLCLILYYAVSCLPCILHGKHSYVMGQTGHSAGSRKYQIPLQNGVLLVFSLIFYAWGCYVGVVALKSYFCKVNRRIEMALSGKNAWTWAGEQNNSAVTEILPASDGGDLFQKNGRLAVPSGLVGPCGIPKSEWGSSPYRVGDHSICRSDSRDCSRCPMNPNRSENEE